jgi:hypothetical protein
VTVDLPIAPTICEFELVNVIMFPPIVPTNSDCVLAITVLPLIEPTSWEFESVVKVVVLPPKVPTNSGCAPAVIVAPPKVPTKAESEFVLKVIVLPPTVPTICVREFLVTAISVPPIVAISAELACTSMELPLKNATFSISG